MTDQDLLYACGSCGARSSLPDGLGDLWVGREFTSTKVLVLGESWYGDPIPLLRYIPAWIAGSERDALFSRLYRASRHSSATTDEVGCRASFWNSLAFTNFVPGTVGAVRRNRPSVTHFRTGQPYLSDVLARLQPANVLILGIEQGRYAAPVCQSAHVPSCIIPHPTGYGVRSSVIQDAYRHLGL